jgi:hypothetical protein
MAGSARRDVASAGLRAVGVTSIARCMRIEARRYGQSDASPRGAMTGLATYVPHVQVAGMIELHAEAPQTRERFECP